MAEVYFIDTNVFIYASGAEHTYKRPCADILVAIADGTFERDHGLPVIDSEVIQEILHRYGARGAWDAGVAVCRRTVGLGLEVLSIGEREALAAVELAETCGKQGLSARDLIHLAVMRVHGIDHIVSADTHFDLCTEVRRIDPLSLSPG